MRQRLRQQDGFALVVALGITIVLAILVTSMISYTSSGSRHARISASQATAQALAEAGISTATSLINNAANAVSPTLLGCSVSGVNPANSAAPCTDLSVAGVNGGTSYFHGMYTQNGNSGSWVITAHGDVTNPSGGANLEKVMTASLSVTGGGQANNISVWNYVYSTGANGGGCEVDITGNNVIVDIPLFVTGDLCLNANNASILENTANGGQAVDVRVLGKLVYAANNTTVGTSGAKITSGLVSGGCTTTIGGAGHTCTPPGDAWYVTNTDTPITATPPTTDFPGWYQNASPGPKHACDTGNLAASKFDSNATMDGTTAQFDLTPASSYTCTTNAGGALSWNSATKILTIAGTIFFDGPLTSSSTAAMYHGTGTVYTNGTFNVSPNNGSLRAGCPASPAAPTHQCAFASTSPEWDPNKDMLLVIANAPGATAVNFSGNNVNYQGGIMCPSTSTMDFEGNNIVLEGPFICGKFIWGQNLTLRPLPTVSNLPPGAPVPPNAPAVIGVPVITGGG